MYYQLPGSISSLTSWIEIPLPIPLMKYSHWSSIFSLIFSFIFFLIVITALTSIPPLPNLSLVLDNTVPLTSLLSVSLLGCSRALSSLLITARMEPGVQMTFDPDGTQVCQKNPCFQVLDAAVDRRKVSSGLKGEYTCFTAYIVMKRKLTDN